MEKVLLVSHGEKNRDIFTQLLAECGLTEVYIAKNTVQARRLLAEYEFALVLIVSPLSEEYGCEVAKTAAKTTAGVMLIVKKDHSEEMTEKMEPEGILVFTPGMGKGFFRHAAKLLLAVHQRLVKTMPQQAKLEQKIEDIRLVGRAKCLLIQYEGMTEEGAHRYIEKEAMNRRITRREMAETILQSYEIE